MVAAWSRENGCALSSTAQCAAPIALLKSDDLDPDMLDERARALLDYVEPNELIMMLDRKAAAAPAPQTGPLN